MKQIVSRRSVACIATVAVLSMIAGLAHAQGRGGGGGGGGMGGMGGGGRGGGMGGGAAPETTWQQFSLDAEGLKFSRDEKRALKDVVKNYNKEIKKIVKGAKQVTPEMQATAQKAWDATNAEIEQMLTEEQRPIWLAAVQARVERQSRRGGMGGMGGRGGGRGGGGRGGGSSQ
jgi:Spy/CpxP family protein refolding chaperone